MLAGQPQLWGAAPEPVFERPWAHACPGGGWASGAASAAQPWAPHPNPAAPAALPPPLAAALPPPPPPAAPNGCSPPHQPTALANGTVLGGRVTYDQLWWPDGSTHKRCAGGSSSEAAALSACKHLAARIKRSATPQELFEALEQEWAALDCTNLAAAFHRLSRLAEAAPGSLQAFRQAHLLGNPCWAWLLDNLPAAAAAPDFGPQAVANTLAALCRLDALSPSLLHALHVPLLRALQQAGSGSGGLNSRGLSQVCWALGREVATRPLLLAVKAPLFQALWVAAPDLDAQGVSAAWYGLGEASSRCLLEELYLEREAPELLPRLAAAARAAAPAMTFEGLAQVLTACTKVRPHPFRDEPLLQALALAAARRLRAGQEVAPPAAVAAIVHALGRLDFRPRCHLADAASGQGQEWANALDDLGASLASSLDVARPQDVSAFLNGLGLLDYVPPAAVLRVMLAHLAGPARLAARTSSPLSDSSGGGAGPEGPEDGKGRRLALEAYSTQELSDLVCSLRRILRHGCYPDSLLPPATLAAFFDSFDTLLGARARLACKVDSSPKLRAAPRRAELALTTQQLGSICWALAGMPGAALTAATLNLLEEFLCRFAPSFSGSALANLLHCYASHGLTLCPAAADAACSRALAILQPGLPGSPAQEQQPSQQGFTLGALARLLSALAVLGINHPPLLRAALPAAHGAVRAAVPIVGAGRNGLTRDLVRLGSSLGQLAASGLLRAAEVRRQAVLPLWNEVGALLQRCCAAAAEEERRLGGGGGGGGGAPPSGACLMRADAVAVQRAAVQLDTALAGTIPTFFLPPAVAGALQAA